MTLDLVQLLMGFLALLVALGGLIWKIGHAQEKRLISHLDNKFEGETKQRMLAQSHTAAMIEDMNRNHRKNETELQNVQRQVFELKAELPEKYVRREDYIRGQTIIESKLDALALRWENSQLRRKAHD